MAALGLEYIGTCTFGNKSTLPFCNMQSCLFKGVGGALAFQTWDEVDEYLATHKDPSDVEYAAAPPQPLPAGVGA